METTFNNLIFVPSADIVNNHLGPSTLSRLHQALIENQKYDGINYFFVSGGRYVPKQTLPAGILMYDYLMSKKIEAEKILIDDLALNSHENIDNLLFYLKENYANKSLTIYVISDWLHLIRLLHLIKIRTKGKSYAAGWKFIHRSSHLIHPLRRIIYEMIAIPINFLDPMGASWITKRVKQNRTQP